MKLDKLQKKVLITLLLLCLLTPIGILLPMFLNAGNAWGEWSAQTVKELIGYVPSGLAKYSDLWKAPVAGYSLSGGDKSIVHQSGFYIVSGVLGATITYIVVLLIAGFITRNEK
jgi:uncharacterized membrane protein YkgB